MEVKNTQDSHLYYRRLVHKILVCLLTYPLVRLTGLRLSKVLRLQKVVFELESQYAVRTDNRKHNGGKTILLKGQMRYIENLHGVAFLCTPLIGNADELWDLGLFVHDLSMHDSSRRMALFGYQHASRLERSIEIQSEKSAQIAANLKMLDEERQCSERLLYSMIPRQIADRLRNGEHPVNTCEAFDNVSLLFSYMEGFTELCSAMTPTQLVVCINSIVRAFDAIIDKHDAFKVETQGDAVYMVAGGVPDRKADHAHSIARVALELLQTITRLDLPHDILSYSIKLNLRIGLHCGGVVAGVVGLRTPQYCLFGDTVNTASRMQSHGQTGKIHASESFLREIKDAGFITEYRDKIVLKGKGEMRTFWLLGQERNPRDTTLAQSGRRNASTDQESTCEPSSHCNEAFCDNEQASPPLGSCRSRQRATGILSVPHSHKSQVSSSQPQCLIDAQSKLLVNDQSQCSADQQNQLDALFARYKRATNTGNLATNHIYNSEMRNRSKTWTQRWTMMESTTQIPMSNSYPRLPPEECVQSISCNATPPAGEAGTNAVSKLCPGEAFLKSNGVCPLTSFTKSTASVNGENMMAVKIETDGKSKLPVSNKLYSRRYTLPAVTTMCPFPASHFVSKRRSICSIYSVSNA